MFAPISLQRGIDDGKPLPAFFEGDVGDAEHLP
jgi:hypothetical protein